MSSELCVGEENGMMLNQESYVVLFLVVDHGQSASVGTWRLMLRLTHGSPPGKGSNVKHGD